MHTFDARRIDKDFVERTRQRQVIKLAAIELGGDHRAVAHAFQGAADEQLTLAAGAIAVSRVEKVHAGLQRGANRGDAVVVVDIDRRDAGDRPAAERDG